MQIWHSKHGVFNFIKSKFSFLIQMPKRKYDGNREIQFPCGGNRADGARSNFLEIKCIISPISYHFYLKNNIYHGQCYDFLLLISAISDKLLIWPIQKDYYKLYSIKRIASNSWSSKLVGGKLVISMYNAYLMSLIFQRYIKRYVRDQNSLTY